MLSVLALDGERFAGLVRHFATRYDPVLKEQDPWLYRFARRRAFKYSNRLR
jgi:hypothetical protein